MATIERRQNGTMPTLVATEVSYCVTHKATDHDDGRAWDACRFRQLFYFENPMDEHTVMWADDPDWRPHRYPCGVSECERCVERAADECDEWGN